MNDDQGSLFGEGRMTAPQPSTVPDPESIRRRLTTILDTLRAAETMPLSERDARMWQTVFPNMANWLPEEEADALRAAFREEMRRLRPAA
jgi:hypothetical protein